MFTIGYKRSRPLDLEKMAEQYAKKDTSYQPFHLANLQAYNPIYNRFFDMNTNNYNQIALNHKLQASDLHTLYDSSGNIHVGDVFVKFSPLLDPLKFITGKYNINDPLTIALPSLDPSGCNTKISNVNNCSYTDAFFSYLSCMLKETHGFVHGVDFYGSALAVQDKFRFNLADDIDFVKDSEFFISGIGKQFTLDENAELLLSDYTSYGGSRANRDKLIIAEDATMDILDLGIETLDLEIIDVCDNTPSENISNVEIHIMESMNESESESESDNESVDKSESDNESVDKSESDNESVAESGCSSGSSCSDKTMDEDEDEDANESVWETESDGNSNSDTDSMYEDHPVYCYLHNFPVQLIMQERCKGTIDSLIVRHKITSDEMVAAMFQIVMILLVYQRVYDFTHNDLHTNNIMYSETDIEYLYYKYDGIVYKVPTYGRIYKLIDFGRAIYRFGSKIFCSDSFAYNGDAYSQYNCEPFFNDKKARLEPNPSFDLCRLACSMYDFYEGTSDPSSAPTPVSDLDTLIRTWCIDDNGENVVYKTNGQERYPGFKLYKMIARTVHNHTPESQLQHDIFKKFIHSTNIDIDTNIMDIDTYPRWQQRK